MESKKCARCGCFFVAENNICPRCEQKDINDIANLKNYLDNNSFDNSIEDLSVKTGITVQNLSRYLDSNNFDYLKSVL